MPGRKRIYAAERLREAVSLLAAHTLKPDLGSDWVEGRHRVLLPIALASVIDFQIDEVEKDFLRAN